MQGTWELSPETGRNSSDSDELVIVDIPEIESDTEESMDSESEKRKTERLAFMFVGTEADDTESDCSEESGKIIL